MNTNQTKSTKIREHQPFVETSKLCRPALAGMLGAILLLMGQEVALSHNTLFLGSGALAGQNVNSSNNQITVAPGAPIQGGVSVNLHNEMPSGAIAPIAATSTWGEPSASFWCVDPWAPTGDSTHDVQVGITAPSVPGTYYIVVASAGTYNCAQIMSGTHPGWTEDWVNGNKVALRPGSDFETAAANGWIPFNWYSPNGPIAGEMAMAVVKVIVTGPSGHNTIFLGSGTLAGQNVNRGSYQITVASGASIQGSFSVNIHNEMPAAAIAPVGETPTWGDPSTSYSCVVSSAPTGDSTLNVPINLTAPSAAGTYYIAVAMAGTYNCAQIMSGTHPGGTEDWAKGNIVARLPASDFETAASNGWIPFSWYSPTGSLPGEMAMAVVRVVVREPSIVSGKAGAFYAGWGGVICYGDETESQR